MDDDLMVSAGGAALREYPELDALVLVSLPLRQRLRRLDFMYWNGAWLRVFTDVVGVAKYEGYVRFEDVGEWDGASGATEPTRPAPREDTDDRLGDHRPAPVVCVTLDDYLHVTEGRFSGHSTEFDDAKRTCALDTIERVNRLIAVASAADVKFSRKSATGSAISSGWRPATVNERTEGASKTSHHIHCKACDIYDPKGDVDQWCLDNLDVLEDLGLWLEDPHFTNTWCHVQTVGPPSGQRVFIPYAGAPKPRVIDLKFANWRAKYQR